MSVTKEDIVTMIADLAANAANVNQIQKSNYLMYVSASCVADGVNTFNTLASAVAAWSTGKSIALAPETFPESITLSQPGMELIGTSKEKTIITNLTITRQDCIPKNLTVSGDLSINCQDTYNAMAWIELNNCIIQGNVSCGTSTVPCIYQFRFFDCQFTGQNKTLILYATNGGRFYRTRIQGLDEQYVVNIYGGQFEFNDECDVSFYNINYLNTGSLKNNLAALIFYRSYVWIKTDFVTPIDNTNLADLQFHWCRVQKKGAYTGNWTFNGLFELDIMDTNFLYPNIVFNSTSNSRITNVTSLGYGNVNTITGTGLANLHIQHSIFGIAAPVGLGEDIGNSWSAFIDG